ncbi:MAG: P27 family phage terminase small subunit [Oscillospiraceae bacterium]|nr:P27 family phage terminase small subunit [Oscillospiraceae bacterium]
MGKRGPQPGSGGRPKKPLAEKISDGNPSKRPLEAITFPVIDLHGEDMPPPSEFLTARQQSGSTTKAVEIYESTWRWLHARSCDHLIPPQVIEAYAQTAARWIQCEEAISTYGFLGKHPTTGAPIQSPFVAIGQSFMKQANSQWSQIYQVVRENCTMPIEGRSPQDDMMEALLSAKK